MAFDTRAHAGSVGMAIAAETRERLEKGLTPNADWYTNDELHELERERVFRGQWQLVGDAGTVREPGNYFVAALDEFAEYIVVRDGDGVLRAFANVCPHRGNRLLAGTGECETIRCGYHGWTFALDGELRNGLGLHEVVGFERQAYGLFPAAVGEWGPFVFLNTDPAATPLMDFLGDLPEVLGRYGIDLQAIAAQDNSRVVTADLQCNWKIAVENALECYHCATVHPGFRATVDLGAWEISVRDACVVQGSRVRRRGEQVGARPDEAPAGQLATALIDDGEGMDEAMFHWLFPNNSVSLWPGPANSFNAARWIPLGPHRTRWWSVRWWPADVPAEVIDDQWSFMTSVGWEDRDIVEGVHRGMRSGSWPGGRFVIRGEVDHARVATTRDERGAAQLNSLIARALLR